MQKRKSILGGSMIAAAVLAVSGFSANAAGLFHHNVLGSGEAVRTNLLQREESAKNFELKCGEKKTDSTASKKSKMGKKGKEGKCGEGKCGETKKKGKG